MGLRVFAVTIQPGGAFFIVALTEDLESQRVGDHDV
jgi:hypothetical protein